MNKVSIGGIAIRQLMREHLLPQIITPATVEQFAEKAYVLALEHIQARIKEGQRRNIVIIANATRGGDKEKAEAFEIRHDELRKIAMDLRAMI